MERRETFKERVEARLQQFEASINVLAARAKAARMDGKEALLNAVDELRSRAHSFRSSLDRVIESGHSAWDEVEKGIELAWDDLQGAYEATQRRFSKQERHDDH
jgi:hypothetical protein